jgi:hypothetical protein
MQTTKQLAGLLVAMTALGSSIPQVTSGGDESFVVTGDRSPTYRIHDSDTNFPPSRNPSLELSSSRPSCNHRLARPASNPRYFGYYVGGTRQWFGDGRLRHEEGTWGWDYSGILFNKAVVLDWAHGRAEVGKSGSYATDHRGRR